jgi:hypothetical protein
MNSAVPPLLPTLNGQEGGVSVRGALTCGGWRWRWRWLHAGIVFSTHCHNDLGLATANTLSGVLGQCAVPASPPASHRLAAAAAGRAVADMTRHDMPCHGMT